jgi:sugar/nucleoside kinase (ribokinase family)
MFIWEPVPDMCSPADWSNCIEALKVVDVVSPHVSEAGEFLGRRIEEDQPFELLKTEVEQIAQDYLYHQTDKNGGAVFRCGKHGCLVATTSIMKWLPAYHQTGKKVVDPTGCGNAFCGGFCAGWIESGGNMITAATYGNIAASFVIEQFGLPQLEYDEGIEKWNGDSVEYRRRTYRSAAGIVDI